MLNFSEDTQPLAAFQQAPDQFLKQVHATKRPLTLTVDGQPAAVIQDPEEYQRLLDLAYHAETLEAIRQGLADSDAGRVVPFEEAVAFLREKYDIPR